MADVSTEYLVKVTDQASKPLAAINKAAGQVDKSFTAMGKNGGSLARLQGGLTKTAGLFRALDQVTMGMIPSLGKLGAVSSNAAIGLEAVGGSAAALINPVTIAAAGVAALTAGIIALGRRGSQVEAVGKSFGSFVTAAGGDTQRVFEGMRQATRGLVTDYELMQLTTQTLAGTTLEFRQTLLAVGQDGSTELGKVVDSINRISQATGQDAELMRTKFLMGLRLMSKKRLDDIGVIVDQTKANEAYAASIGKAAGALSDQEKQTAFMIAGVQELQKVASEVSGATLMENLMRPMVAIRNVLDHLAVAILPLATPIGEFIGMLATGFQKLADVIIMFVAPAFSVLGEMLQFPLDIMKGFVEAFVPINQLMELLTGLAGIVWAIGDVIVTAWKDLAKAIVSIFSIVSNVIGKFLPSMEVTAEGFAARAGQWGGKIIGTFAAGMANAATGVVKVVTEIARVIADFLQGFSPPKKGPLSKIDQGGRNVALAWLGGFAGGFSDVAEVEKAVDGFLRPFMGLTKQDLEERLKTLDKAIQPFVDQLELAKGFMEEISGFVDPAMKVLERQQRQLLEAFTKGGASADQVRALDMQLFKLAQLKDAEEDRVAQAELQLAIAKSAQAGERAALNILLGRVQATEELTKKTEAVKKGGAGAAVKTPAEAKEKKLKGKGEADAEEYVGGLGTGIAESPDLLGGAKAAGEAFKTGFKDGFEGATEESFAGFTLATGELQNEIGRIVESDPVQGIISKFDGLTSGLSGIINEAKGIIAGIVSTVETVKNGIGERLDAIKTVFDNVMGSDGIQNIIQTVTDLINGLDDAATISFNGVLAAINLVKTPFEEAANIIGNAITKVLTVLGLGSVVGAAGEKAQQGGQAAETAVQNATGGLVGALMTLASPGGILSIGGAFVTAINLIFGDNGILATGITTVTALIDGLILAFNGIAVAAITAFVDVKQGITGALGGLVEVFQTHLIDPLLSALDKGIDAIDQMIPDAINVEFTIPRIAIPTPLGEIELFPGGKIGETIDLPDNPLRDFVGAAAKGGIGLRTGSWLVGERGPELLTTRKRTNVFPAHATRGIMDLLARPEGFAMRGNGGGNIYNQQRTVSNTFNGYSAGQSTLMARQMEAYSR